MLSNDMSSGDILRHHLAAAKVKTLLSRPATTLVNLPSITLFWHYRRLCLSGLLPSDAISAQLFVANIKSSCDFYTNKLGFAVEFIYGDPPYYGQVIRDNARLALRLVFEPVFVGDVRQREHLLSASITVGTANEIKQLFLSYQTAGVSFHQALKNEPWGARTFIVSDPDENLILFAGPAAD